VATDPCSVGTGSSSSSEDEELEGTSNCDYDVRTQEDIDVEIVESHHSESAGAFVDRGSFCNNDQMRYVWYRYVIYIQVTVLKNNVGDDKGCTGYPAFFDIRYSVGY
jgi:hypothetical protein